MKQLFLLFIASSLIFASSCRESIQPEEPAQTVKAVSETLPLKFKIDGKEVLENSFYAKLLPNQASFRDASSQMTAIADKYRVLCEFGRTESDGKYDVINVFMDNEAYYAYADANGHTKERLSDMLIKDLADYAVSSGAISECEATGNVPNGYTDYMDRTLQSLGFQPSTPPEAQSRAFFSFVYKECYGTGNSWPVRTLPWLGVIGYNNQISSYFPFGASGSNSVIFDQWFFTKPITNIWSWDFNTVNFCNPRWNFVNDRATSWLNIG
jgi:hypothetical protein